MNLDLEFFKLKLYLYCKIDNVINNEISFEQYKYFINNYGLWIRYKKLNNIGYYEKIIYNFEELINPLEKIIEIKPNIIGKQYLKIIL